ncbi:condensation domain-containing protein [Nocardia sp. NPDC060249]|uniref:condensation domain-containing protein n=1 Tax=Nocardia sp. NPDC060249 TaxID=3347082 RepID=UPI003656692F
MNTTVATHGLTIDGAVESLRLLVSRHEALRTRFALSGADTVEQHVDAAPSTPAELEKVIEVTTPARAAADFAEAKRTVFDLDRHWPFKAIFSEANGSVREIGLVADHAALDDWGVKVAREDLELITQYGSVDKLASQVSQPLDEVAWQQSDAGGRHLEQALQYWTGQLRQLNDALGVPRQLVAPSSRQLDSRPFLSAFIASARLPDTAERVAAALRVPVSSVFLAAFAIAVSRVTASAAVGVHAHVVNRLRGPQQASASNMFMRAPVVVKDAPLSRFRDVAAAAFAQQIRGSNYSNLERGALERVREIELSDEHSLVLSEAWFNFQNATVFGTDEIPSGQLSGSGEIPLDRVHYRPGHSQGRSFMLKVKHWRERVVLDISWRADLLENAAATEVLTETVRIVNDVDRAL